MMWIFSATAISLLPGCHDVVYGFTFTCRSSVGKSYSRTASAAARRSISVPQIPTTRLGSPLFMGDAPTGDHSSLIVQKQDGQANRDADATSYDITRHPFQSRTDSLSTPLHADSNDQDETDRQAKLDVVKRWLLFHLPKLQPRDVEIYSKRFVEDGFDSAETLWEVVEEDLDFMKVAHQRALGKKLTKGKDIEKAKGVVHALDRLTESVNNTDDGMRDFANFITGDQEECEGEECFDITRGTFMERTTQSLSTTRIPSYDSSSDPTTGNQVAANTTPRQSDDYFDITQNLFPERPKSLSSSNNLATTQAKSRSTNKKDILKSDGSSEEEFFDITQNLFPEPPKTSLATGRLFSAFNEREKSEMNNRPAPRSIDGRYFDITKQHFSNQRTSLPLSVNSGTVKPRMTTSGAAVDSKRGVSASEDTGQVVDVNNGSNLSEIGSERIKGVAETDALDSFVDITKEHFTPDRPSSYVNTGTIKQGTTSGSSKESQTNFSTAAQSSDYIDITKEHFSDRSSFSLLVNSGTKKEGTTFASWDESRKNLRKSLSDGGWLPMSERTKDDNWRKKRTPRSAYLDNPQFSSDLCPPSFARSDATQIGSRQPLSATANTAKEQRFNTSAAEYRYISSWSDRQPLSSTANAAPKQRFNTTGDYYRDTYTTTDRQPLSSIANAPPHQRFKTSDEGYRDISAASNRPPPSSFVNSATNQRFRTNEKIRYESSSFSFPSSNAVHRRFTLGERRKIDVVSKDTQPLSMTVHSKTRRFKTVEQKSLLKSSVASLNTTSHNFDVPRAFITDLEMVTRSGAKNISAVSIGRQHIDKINFSENLSAPSKVKNVTMTEQEAGSKAASKNELPLSMTIHSGTNRFNTTEKSSSSFAGVTAANLTVGFDVPRAFIRNIEMVTHSEAKTNSLKSSRDHRNIYDHKFSPNLSVTTKVTNKKQSNETNKDANQEQNFDANDFATNPSTSSISLKSTKTQQQLDTDQVIFVDEKKFSSDLTRLSTTRRKPGSAMKSTPHADHGLGVDLNPFSSVPDLCPPSKLKTRKPSDTVILTAPQTASADRFLDLSTHRTVNTQRAATTRGSPAVISDDPYVNVPQFSEVLSGPLRVKNLTAALPASAVTKDDLDVDLNHFSPISELCPPSVKHTTVAAPCIDDLDVDRHQFSSVSDICPPSKVKLNQLEKEMALDEVSVDRFLDLSSQYTVNISSRTLGSHAVVSNDPYVDRTHFSSDLSPPSKVRTLNAEAIPQYFDITRALLPTLSRNVSSVRDAISASKVKAKRENLVEFDQSADERLESSHREVKSWLLSRLPDLDIEKVEVYAKHLIKDGFDSADMMEEIIEDDLVFMGGEHKHAFIINDWLLSHLPDLEAAVVTSYSKHLSDDGFDSLDMLKELTEEDLLFMRTAHRRVLAKVLKDEQAKANVDEEDTNGVSDGDECFDITRDSFPTRTSLASDPNHHLTPSTKSKPVVSQVLDSSRARTKEESFDITRDSFPNRPSLAEVPRYHMSSSLRERSTRQKSGMEVLSAPIADPKHHSSTKASEKPDTTKSNQERHQVHHVTTKSPRAELYQFYINKGFTAEQASELKDFYTIWTNGALPHEKKYTCVFTCPISGDHFLSSNWEDVGEVDSVGRVYWFKTKKAAMSAAASYALGETSSL
eukprot:CCRYP_011308-RA/>CCRYP_011308-RA protein AED:0.06 eAED:0.06 QI:213/1/0.66/1/1/1/3/0/1648